jgi:hypothetical protein
MSNHKRTLAEYNGNNKGLRYIQNNQSLQSLFSNNNGSEQTVPPKLVKKAVHAYKGQNMNNLALSADLGANSIFSSGNNSIRKIDDMKHQDPHMKVAQSNIMRKNNRKQSSLINYS